MTSYSSPPLLDDCRPTTDPPIDEHATSSDPSLISEMPRKTAAVSPPPPAVEQSGADLLPVHSDAADDNAEMGAKSPADPQMNTADCDSHPDVEDYTEIDDIAASNIGVNEKSMDEGADVSFEADEGCVRKTLRSHKQLAEKQALLESVNSRLGSDKSNGQFDEEGMLYCLSCTIVCLWQDAVVQWLGCRVKNLATKGSNS